MDWLNNLGAFADDRLLANLIGLHLVLGLIYVTSLILRGIIMHGGSHVVGWTGLHWLDGVSKEAVRRARALLFWTTISLMLLSVVGGVAYQLMGRDIRHDVKAWYSELTGPEIFDLGVGLGELVLVAIGVYFGVRLVRRLKRNLEVHALQHLPFKAPAGLKIGELNGPSVTDQEHKDKHEQTVKHWFNLLERFAICTVLLTGIWVASFVVHLSGQVDWLIGFSIRMLAIFMVSRLLILACRTLSHSLAALGNHHLNDTKVTRYWDRVKRLFPFGEKCFEAAVYISATSLCVDCARLHPRPL